MQGRWIIANVGLGVQVRSMTGSKAEAPEGITPVVPCDDAAIERAARALAERQGSSWSYGNNPAIAEEYREDIRASFRAAGETP